MWFTWITFATIVSFVYSNDFNNQILALHNKYRDMHGVPHVSINPKINQFAKKWANFLAKTNKFEHRPNNKYGENLYSTNGTLRADDAMAAFYNENKLYNYDYGGFSHETGHFTQLIWKNSKQIGIGVAKAKNGWKYLVINYDPPGNVQDQYQENVPKPKDTKKKSK